jgi:hypothetical protein
MSSRLSRLFRREASSKINWTSTTTKTSPPLYKSNLIRNRITNVEDPDHLDQVARHDPLANFIVYGVADMIFDDGYKFVDENGEEVMQDALKELKRLNADRAFIQCLAAERWGGWSYQYTGKNKWIPESREGGRLASLFCFTRNQCSVFEYTENGEPLTMKINLTVGVGTSQQGKEFFLPAKDFIIWNTRPIGRGYTGRSILEPIWTLLIEIRELFDAMTWYDRKIGHGMFTAWVHAGFDETTLDKWQTAFEDMSTRRALVVDSGDVEELKFIGPTANATDFVEHIDMCIQTLSVPVGIPKELLMGAAAGAVTGSETNIKLGDEQERKLKLSIEPYIRETVRRMGYSNNDYIIEWIEKTAHTEEDRIKMEQTHAQAQATKIHLTIDELRDIDGYPPLPDGRGDKLQSEQASFGIDVQGLQNPEEEEKTQNPEGKQI